MGCRLVVRHEHQRPLRRPDILIGVDMDGRHHLWEWDSSLKALSNAKAASKMFLLVYKERQRFAHDQEATIL